MEHRVHIFFGIDNLSTHALSSISTFNTWVDASRLSNKTMPITFPPTPASSFKWLLLLKCCQFGKLFSCSFSWLSEKLITLSCLLPIIFLLWSAFLYPLLIFLLEIFLFSYWFVILLEAMDNSLLVSMYLTNIFSLVLLLLSFWWSLPCGVLNIHNHLCQPFPSQILVFVSWLKIFFHFKLFFKYSPIYSHNKEINVERYPSLYKTIVLLV